MMQTTLETPPARFSLRTALLVLTGVVIALGITAPWVQSLSGGQQRLMLSAAAGMILGIGLGSMLAWWLLLRAARRAGPCLVLVPMEFRWFWRLGGVAVFLIWPAMISSSAYLQSFVHVVYGALYSCFMGFLGTFVLLLSMPLQVCQDGTVRGFRFRRWSQVVEYGWYNRNTFYLIWPDHGGKIRYEYFRARQQDRPRIESILAERVVTRTK